MFGKLQVLYQYIFSEHYYVYLHRHNDLQIYLILPSTLVTIPKLKQEIRNWVLKRNPLPFLFSEGEDRLGFAPQEVSFFRFVEPYKIFIAAWFILTFCFSMAVGWIWIRSHFESAFWSLCLLFLLITELISDFVFYRGLQFQELLDTSRLRQQMDQVLLAVEQEYFTYQKKKYTQLREAFLTSKNLDHFMFSEDGFRGMVLNEKGVTLSYQKRNNDFANNVLLIASPVILAVMRDHPFQRDETPYSHRSSLMDRDSRLFPDGIPWAPGRNSFFKARGNLFESVLEWNPRSLDAASMSFADMFAQRDVGQLMPINFSNQNMWLFVNRSQAGEPFGIYIACITEANFLTDFFQNLQDLKLNDGIRLSIFQDHGGTEKLFGKNTLNSAAFQKYFNAFGSEAGKVFFIDEGLKTSELGVFRRSYHFRGWSILISIPNQMIDSNQIDLQFKYRLHFFLFVLGLAIGGTVLLRRILIPVQTVRYGFTRVELGDLDHDIVVTGRHEGSQVQIQYKKMLEGLRLKRKMAPFVSEAVNHLFQKLQKGERKIAGRACMLFSDIRGFTSISEQHDPAEIVKMLNDYFSLWQPIVEKENGIIIRFIGDAVVAIFLQETNPDYMVSAVRASSALMSELKVMNQHRQDKGLFTIQNGIGLAESEILFTVIGDEEKSEFLILGQAHEVSELLEAESKLGTATKIILEETIKNACPPSWEFLDFHSSEFPESTHYELKSLLDLDSKSLA